MAVYTGTVVCVHRDHFDAVGCIRRRGLPERQLPLRRASAARRTAARCGVGPLIPRRESQGTAGHGGARGTAPLPHQHHPPHRARGRCGVARAPYLRRRSHRARSWYGFAIGDSGGTLTPASRAWSSSESVSLACVELAPVRPVRVVLGRIREPAAGRLVRAWGCPASSSRGGDARGIRTPPATWSPRARVRGPLCSASRPAALGFIARVEPGSIRQSDGDGSGLARPACPLPVSPLPTVRPLARGGGASGRGPARERRGGGLLEQSARSLFQSVPRVCSRENKRKTDVGTEEQRNTTHA